MATAGSESLVDEFETSFKNCLSALTSQEYYNTHDSDEVRTSVEQAIQRYVDVAKQFEAFFLQKRLLLSIHRPEQLLKEDINELKQELQRKESLLVKHHEKLANWQNLLSHQQPGHTAQTAASTAPTTPQPGPTQQLQMQGQLQSQQQQQQQQAPPLQPAAPNPAMGPPHMPPGMNSLPQGPLAFLEQTTSNIGLPERR